MLRTRVQQKIGVCMQGRRECCPVCVRIPEVLVPVRVATHVVWYATKCNVASHNTSNGLLGILQASNIGEQHTKTLFRSTSSSII